MKKHKRLINFLAGITKVFLIITSVLLTTIFVVISYQLLTGQASKFSSEHANINYSHEYDASLHLDTKIFYRNGETIETEIETSSISAPVILTGSIGYAILYMVLILLFFGNVIFLILQFQRIFSYLKQSIREGSFFHKNIHQHIKRIAYSLFAFAFLMFFNKIFFILSIKKIEIMDQSIETSITIGSNVFLNLFFGLVILLIAEIFKEGMNLKKESELTI